MGIVKALLIVVEAICSLLLIGVILLQRSKSEGLGVAFGGGTGDSLFGSRTGNVRTKITITLSGVFVVTTILLGILFSNYHSQSIIDQRTAPLPVQQPVAQPQQQAAPTASPSPAAPANTLLPGSSFEDQPVAPAAPSAPAQEAPAATPQENPQ